MYRKRLFSTAFIVVCIALIISLIMNDIYSKRMNREHQYTHMLYNQLMFDVYTASGYGGLSKFPRFQKASVNMAYAASVLHDLFFQASMVNNEKLTEQIQEDAGFASYLSLALVGQNQTYLTGPDNKTVVTITLNEAKNLVIKMNQIIFKNVVNGSDIPDDKIDAVYKGIYDLIPAEFKALPGGSVFDVYYH